MQTLHTTLGVFYFCSFVISHHFIQTTRKNAVSWTNMSVSSTITAYHSIILRSPTSALMSALEQERTIIICSPLLKQGYS